MCDINKEEVGIVAAGIILFTRKTDINIGDVSDPCFLLLKCSKNGHWSPPKGMAESDEMDNLLNTAYRETMEESGISSDKIQIYDGFQKEIYYEAWNKRKKVVYYLGECEKAPKVTISDEHSEYKWARMEEVRRLIEFKSMIQIYESAYERIMNGQEK